MVLQAPPALHGDTTVGFKKLAGRVISLAAAPARNPRHGKAMQLSAALAALR
jgi:hypothetical protein